MPVAWSMKAGLKPCLLFSALTPPLPRYALFCSASIPTDKGVGVLHGAARLPADGLFMAFLLSGVTGLSTGDPGIRFSRCAARTRLSNDALPGITRANPSSRPPASYGLLDGGK